ncbi:LytTR family DNA-binding domain-containing protein [Rheinheimera baltica]|uniref:LytR/AlgR family response regulator transcription factor n=1 Tax=Rheinheimera baltica TaxID=67576 RepID=UPI00040D5F02|nr:LytTR family DNA-binding domain-containing protein [Rheinheimera baltica]MDP5141946.1 LytTR family DNA-binding domain-containing protein [Rheinheimera baltica]
MRILIVDDEPLARARLKRLIAGYTNYTCIGEAETAQQAFELVGALQPDVLLLDIEMPQQDGLSLGKRILALPTPPALIYVTAHPEYALEAYQASPADYVLKPVSEQRLLSALERVGKQTKAHIEKKQQEAKFTFMQGGVSRKIAMKDILYFTAEDKYVRMVYRDGDALIEQSLAHLETLKPELFLRIHRQNLVNISYIQRLYLIEGQHWITLNQTDIKLKVSRRAVSSVKSAAVIL